MFIRFSFSFFFGISGIQLEVIIFLLDKLASLSLIGNLFSFDTSMDSGLFR